MAVYEERNNTEHVRYTKGKLLKDGGEGYIYEVRENPNLLMKIYKETDPQGLPIVTPELERKLEYMKDNPPELLVSRGIVAWPTELVRDDINEMHWTNKQRPLLGFVMPKLDITGHLQRIYAYRHPSSDASDYGMFPSVRSRLSVAINLCSALHELHKAGYVVGDFNHTNIGVNYSTGQVYFVDCDSFHICGENGDVFRTNVIMAGYLAPEIISHCNAERAAKRQYNLDEVALPTFTKESDLFCLAIHIFKLLMNGVDPFRGIKYDASGSTASPFVGNEAIERNAYVFREGNRPSAVFCPPAWSLPLDISILFKRAFVESRTMPSIRPTAEEWYRALSEMLTDSMVQCKDNEKHQYLKSLAKCPYCEADKQYLEEYITPVDEIDEKPVAESVYCDKCGKSVATSAMVCGNCDNPQPETGWLTSSTNSDEADDELKHLGKVLLWFFLVVALIWIIVESSQ
jgi:Uncharacterized protein with protein kinase and helix-hairpin-helix DNA-binding domains